MSLAINKFFDENEDKLSVFIAYFRKLFEKRLISLIDIQQGLALLFNQLPLIEADIPHLPNTLSKFLLDISFGDSKLIDFKDLCIHTLERKEDTDISIYVKLVAVLT